MVSSSRSYNWSTGAAAVVAAAVSAARAGATAGTLATADAKPTKKPNVANLGCFNITTPFFKHGSAVAPESFGASSVLDVVQTSRFFGANLALLVGVIAICRGYWRRNREC
jgi:hypothetical protein